MFFYKTIYLCLFIMHLINDGRTMPRRDMIFPDELDNFREAAKTLTLDNPPNCAKHLTFCEDVDSYPYEEVRKILEKKQVSADAFESEKLAVEAGARLDEGVRYLCNTRTSTIFPKIGKTVKKKWNYIINQQDEDGYVQGIVVETCRNEAEPCELQCELAGFVTACTQKYATKRLFTVNNHGDVVKEYFLMPSTCVCTYKRGKNPLLQLSLCRNRSKHKSILPQYY